MMVPSQISLAADHEDPMTDHACPPPQPGRAARLRRWILTQLARYEFTGLAVGAAFALLSATPSLLPRSATFQGIVTGACAASGYGVGVFFAWLARFMVSRGERWPSPPRAVWFALAIVTVLAGAWMGAGFVHWQNEIRDLMGLEHLRWWAYPQAAVVALAVGALLMALGRGWAALIRRLARWTRRWLPPRVAGVLAGGLVAAFTYVLVTGVVASTAMDALNSSFATTNQESDPDTVPPTSATRSGGPDSLVTWDSLGRNGRKFVTNAPTVEQLTDFNGRPATTPIRVFAGLESGPTIRESADLAAQELVRTGGLQREVVAIASTTGTGWINRSSADSLEYMFNGDTAIVGLQYSYLPSWLSFLVDRERARQAGVALFEAVDAKVQELPESQRPRVVVFGESLGSYASEAAFGTINTVAARTDGALFVGPTFSNTIWRDVTRDRDPGSPERLPVYEDGDQVRFIASPADLDRPTAEWGEPRLIYLQHASDPIAWWSPELLLEEPDWLREPRGDDVLPSVRWIPVVSFLQVSADMAVGIDVPDGHGHRYVASIPYAWAQILQPPSWTSADTDRLVPLLRRS